MQGLARISVMRPVFATVLVLALAVVGLFAIPRLGVDRFPSVDFPWVTVVTTLPGATPAEVETEITEEIERQVNTVSGIDQITSTSSEGISVVQIQFVLEKDPDIAAQEIRSKVDLALPNLPKKRWTSRLFRSRTRPPRRFCALRSPPKRRASAN
jgi:hydrophobic/amphiphilic exporter-1 (mainly G- bacteria), HAE1 family